MGSRNDLVENHSGYFQICIEMLEALQHGCRGVARIARADHQHHRYSHQTGQFGPASLRFPETVEQSSLPFYETYIGLFAITVVEGLQ